MFIRRREVRIKAMQYLYAYHFHRKLKSPLFDGASENLRKHFKDEVQAIQKGVFSILQLLSFWRTFLAQDQEKAHFTAPLLSSSLLKRIERDMTYAALEKKYDNLWDRESALLLYYEQASYLKGEGQAMPQNEKEELAFLKKLLTKIIFSNQGVQKELSALDIHWEENSPLLKANTFYFFRTLTKAPKRAFDMLTTPPSSEDIAFYTTLIRGVIANFSEYEKHIHEKLKHWKLERLVPIDLILISMGLVEASQFAQTPRAVLVHEYLEIAKQYSTPKSALFIHGMLDTLLQALYPLAVEPKNEGTPSS